MTLFQGNKPNEPASTDSASSRRQDSMTYRMTLTAMLTVIALMFAYIEAMIPITLGIPGFKLGFANIMIIIALYALDGRYALAVDLTRIIMAGLLFGTPFSTMYSLAGGMISLAAMWILKKMNLFSVIGISMAGGVFHNLGQLLVAAAVVSNLRMFIYFPVLIFTGIATGIGTGVIAYAVLRKMPESIIRISLD